MDSLIEEAERFKSPQKNIEDEFFRPQIVVVGVGGSGCNTVNRLMQIGIENVMTIAINTDYQHLKIIKAHKRVLIGKRLTKGLGAGGYPEIGRKAAESAKDVLEKLLEGANMVFVCAGMGGGTGTGAAPVVAEVAKNNDAIVIGVATMPFSIEKARLIKAYEGLEEFRRHCDTVIVLDNNKLIEYYPHMPIDKAFGVMDQIIARTIKGITDTIMYPSMMNIDFADIKAIMKNGEVAALFVGESKTSQNRAVEVVKNCLSHPLLEVDVRGATGALVHISGGKDLSIKEVHDIVEELTFELRDTATIKIGARIYPELDGVVRVVAIMTGVKSPNLLSRKENGLKEIVDIKKKTIRSSKRISSQQNNNGLIDHIDYL
jgi:cell division protein FtsZ